MAVDLGSFPQDKAELELSAPRNDGSRQCGPAKRDPLDQVSAARAPLQPRTASHNSLGTTPSLRRPPATPHPPASHPPYAVCPPKNSALFSASAAAPASTASAVADPGRWNPDGFPPLAWVASPYTWHCLRAAEARCVERKAGGGSAQSARSASVGSPGEEQ